MRNWLLFSFCFTIFFNSTSLSIVKPFTIVTSKPYLSTGVLVQRTVSIKQQACSCPNTFSCSCCQSVTILLRHAATNLCVNFTYAQTGLSMDILLGSNTIRHVSVIDYRAFKICTSIPDCFHSHACVDAIELSRYPRSITICIQLAVTSKSANWLINYNCISLSTILPNQNQTGTNGTAGQPAQMPAGQTPSGQTPSGQMPSGQMPAGQMPAGQMPSGQTPAAQMPAGQMPTGQMPAAQMPAGQMPAGQMPSGQTPAGQMPSGQMPAGQMPAGQMPSGQTPAGQMPSGQTPAAQMPAGQMPSGQMPAGQMPSGQTPAGQMPSGQMPSGQMPAGQMPAGQMPPGQTQGLMSGRDQKRVLKSAKRVSGFLSWVSSKKAREMASADRIIKNPSNTRELRSVGEENEAINILRMNQIPEDILREQGQELENRDAQSDRFSSRTKIGNPNNLNTGNSISKNYFSIELNSDRKRRDIRKEGSNGSSAMRMQVILRGRKNRLPRIIGNNPTKNFKNHPRSRTSGIVNQDTISIPMTVLGSSGNVAILDTMLSNNPFTPAMNESQMVLVAPQQIPAIIPYGLPVPPSIPVLQNVPSVENPTPQDFLINYDNRTSSFPDRMPPIFGITSRIGPIDKNESPQSFDRSVEELETVRPQIQLLPNSKIIESISTTEFSDGRIIFPE